jgi:hypothetical protein
MTNGRKLSTLSKIVHSPTFITGVGFLAGVFATGIIHALIGGVLDKPEVVIWGIVSFLALMVALAIVLIVREGQEVLGNQEEILQGLEKKFGLKAEFIRDIRHGDEANTGHSYRRTQEYIENAEENLIFVDSWVKSDHYDKSQARKDYYQAIEKQIRSMLSRGEDGRSGVFYHRIIQLPPGEQPNVILQDTVYAEHLKECAKLQKDRRDRIRVDRAEPFTHVHFSIIDDRYLVEAILTTSSEHGLKRHGAIIFTDPEHALIERYKDIIGNLDLTEIGEGALEITESQLQTDQ